MTQFLVVWAYLVHPEFQAEFESAYHSEGDWALFFRRDEHYLGTELRRDTHNPQRYLTLDYWTSQSDYEAFKVKWQAEYQALDARFENWTSEETFIGQFNKF